MARSRRRLSDSFGVLCFSSHFASRFADGGGDGGGGGGDKDFESRVKEAVDRELQGIKSSRDEFRKERDASNAELSKIRKQLESLGGTEGIEKLSDFRKRLEGDELGKMLAEGKHDEWFEKRSAGMRGDLERKIRSAEERAASLEKERDLAVRKYGESRIQTEVRAAASVAGVVPSALLDVDLRAMGAFSYTDEHGVVIKDKSGEIVYGKDPKVPMTPAEWIDKQRETSPHWFPAPQGAGATGGKGRGLASLSPDEAVKLPDDQFNEWMKQSGQKNT